MAKQQNGPRTTEREPSQETKTTGTKVTRCRRVEVVHTDLVIGPCDQCAQCGEYGTWEADHTSVCSWRALHRELAAMLAGDPRG